MHDKGFLFWRATGLRRIPRLQADSGNPRMRVTEELLVHGVTQWRLRHLPPQYAILIGCPTGKTLPIIGIRSRPPAKNT
jgi:hypothetical protein